MAEMGRGVIRPVLLVNTHILKLVVNDRNQYHTDYESLVACSNHAGCTKYSNQLSISYGRFWGLPFFFVVT